jgi:FkbM family methyltransferase
MTLGARFGGLARHGRARVRRKLVWEADRALTRYVTELDRLRRLTPIAASRAGPRLLFDTRDQEMGPHIWAHGGYDEADLAWILDRLGQPQRGRTVVEVGGNVGTTAIPLLHRFGAAQVEIFEPGPDNVRLLRCNLILNDLEDRAVVHPAAVSDRTGTATLELCDWNSGDHRIAAVDRSWEVLGESTRATVSVDVGRLDDLLVSDPADVGLVWVDTQGHEAHVLAGASRLLGRGIPWVIEYWPYGLARAGATDRLHAVVAGQFAAVIDVRRSRETGVEVRVEPDQLAQLGRRLGTGYTDLILLEA